jgi:hypothetical protein
MSYGFIRKMSPAAINEARSRAAAARYHRLTKVQVDEVSVCDRAVNPGAKIVFTKRFDERDRQQEGNPMSNVSNITVTDVIKAMKAVMPGPSIAAKVDAANEMLANGRIDGVVHAQLQQRFADERYPGDRCALSKFINDPDGGRMTNFGAQTSYVNMQKRTAANAAEVITKMNKPHAVHAQPEPEDYDDDDGGEGTIDQKVERLMQSRNISRDAAISILHRLEKRARGFTF